ncbi:MAG: leucyl aminopeptidase, partial [Nitrospiraceae bacterium]|nr:leucyl aminopeptidase [Nitrospiraceae bacterium]
MKIMQVTVQVGRAETASAEALVLTHCEGEAWAKQDAALLDRALGGALSKLVQSKEFEGKANEVLLYHTQDAVPTKRLVLVGLGKKTEVTLETIRQAMGSAAKRVRRAKVGSYTVVLPTVPPGGMSWVEVAQAMVEGAILGSYQFTVYRTAATSEQDVAGMRILIPKKGQLRQVTEGIRRGVATAEATVFVRDLCNHPSNILTPTRVANEAKTLAKTEGITIKILEQKEMERLGMGALLGVARGSQEQPKFIILEYNGSKKKDVRPVVLVGKTITFDTGGISLKTAENMERMKADMT